MCDATLIYRSFIEAIDDLPAEYQYAALRAICMYGMDGTIPESGIPAMAVKMAKPVVDKYNVRREASKRGGESNRKRIEAKLEPTDSLPIAESKPADSQTEAKGELIETQVEIKDNISTPPISPSRGTRFVKPTKAEVDVYIREHGYHFSADAFIAFYESNGWKVGKNPMKSWQQACVTWEARRKEESETKRETARSGTKSRNARPESQHDYDWDSIESMLLEAQARGA